MIIGPRRSSYYNGVAGPPKHYNGVVGRRRGDKYVPTQPNRDEYITSRSTSQHNRTVMNTLLRSCSYYNGRCTLLQRPKLI